MDGASMGRNLSSFYSHAKGKIGKAREDGGLDLIRIPRDLVHNLIGTAAACKSFRFCFECKTHSEDVTHSFF